MTLLEQLHLDAPPPRQGVLLSGPFRTEDRAEQSADVYRRRGIQVAIEPRGKRWIVVDVPEGER